MEVITKESWAELMNIQAHALSYHGRMHAWYLFIVFENRPPQDLRLGFGNLFRAKLLAVSSAFEQKIQADSRRRCDDCEISSHVLQNFALSAKGMNELGFFQTQEGTQTSPRNCSHQEQLPTDRSFWDFPNYGFALADLSNRLAPVYKKRHFSAFMVIAGDTSNALESKFKEINHLLHHHKLGYIDYVEKGKQITRKKKNGETHFFEPFGYRDGLSKINFWQKTENEEWELHPTNKAIVLDQHLGSYIVFRKLEQDVTGFKSWLDQLVDRELDRSQYNKPSNYRKRKFKEQIKGKLMGRLPNGEPLIKSTYDNNWPPEFDRYSHESQENGFEGDPEGVICPFSAHIRRANPRNDSLLQDPQGDYLPISGEKIIVRIARRSIPYKSPKELVALVEELKNLKEDMARLQRVMQVAPENTSSFIQDQIGAMEVIINRKIAKYENERTNGTKWITEAKKGLLFLSYQASVRHQFEVIANDWLSKIPDSFAISGKDQFLKENSSDVFTPSSNGSTSFVHYKGGGIFYAPSISWLENL